MPPPEIVRPTDEGARRLTKTIIRKSRFAALACLDPASGAPLASRVSAATDEIGQIVFLISQLSAHFAALEADPRASLLLGEPGKGDPLAHPRMTMVGRALKLTGECRIAARERFLRRHPKAALYADFSDFAFWKLLPERVSLNGGFGKAFELTTGDIVSAHLDGLAAAEYDILQHMNEDHSAAVAGYARLAGESPGKWVLTGVDAEGLDLKFGDAIGRLWFDKPLISISQVRPVLSELSNRAKSQGR